MGYLPSLSEAEQTRLFTDTFLGYDHNRIANDGTWYRECNLSSREYPLMAVREPRGITGITGDLDGLIVKDAPAWVKDCKLYYKNEQVPGITLTDSDKQLVSLGAYICVFPDGIYVNTQNLSDYGYMGNRYEGTGASISVCNVTGEAYDIANAAIGSKAPDEPKNGAYWIDTGSKVHTLKEYSESSGTWVQVPTVYVKIAAEGINEGFREQDSVRIRGLHCWNEPTTITEQVEAMNTDSIIQAIGDGYIIVVGILDRAVELTGIHLSIERRVPKLDYVCELDNRLWGCYYGIDNNGPVNGIYACALGDPRNWYRYAGISTDSYAVSVGSDGPFTGICAYGGYVLAWKEKCVHKIYGTTPSTFQVTTQQLRGVSKGSYRSLAVVNEALYYLSGDGVCVYDGSSPASIFDAFAGAKYTDGRAGSLYGHYYISMRSETGHYEMWVYDASKQIWHNEGRVKAKNFAQLGNDMIYIDEDAQRIISETGANGTKEGPVEWFAESGYIGFYYASGNKTVPVPEHKYISRFNIRMQLAPNAMMKIEVEYDSNGHWQQQMVITGSPVLRTFTVPVIPVRCDHMRIRLSGQGDVKIYSIAKVLEVGSDA